MKSKLWILVCAALFLAACQPEPNDFPPRPTDTPGPLVTRTLEPTSTAPALDATPTPASLPKPLRTLTAATLVAETPVGSGPLEDGLTSYIDLARADLANRLSIAADQIQVVEARSVTWPDGSLGCPKPGIAYTQVLVDGTLIRLEASTVVYEYHGGGERPPTLCPSPAKPASP